MWELSRRRNSLSTHTAVCKGPACSGVPGSFMSLGHGEGCCGGRRPKSLRGQMGQYLAHPGEGDHLGRCP